MHREQLINTVKLTRMFFDKSTSRLVEDDSNYRPQNDMFTAAEHVAHVAQTIDWFVDGAFGDGFDMDFEKHFAKIRAVEGLTEARTWLQKSTDDLLKRLTELPDEEWAQPIKGPIMAGAPRSSIVNGIAEHTSHHRGALAVYQRLLGKTPEMPYA